MFSIKTTCAIVALAVAAFVSTSCTANAQEITCPGAVSTDSLTTISEHLAEVHGGAGPWALLGYRMGAFAAHHLGAAKSSRELDITHEAVMEPQYACMADGLAVATGNSLGQLNLRLSEVPTTGAMTTRFKRSRGASEELILQLKPEIFAQFENVPMNPDAFAKANQEIMKMSDEDLFTTSSAAHR